MKKVIVIGIVIFLSITAGLFTQNDSFTGIGRVSAAEPVFTAEADEVVAVRILRSTVRLHLQAWRVKEDESGYFLDESIGHATLKDGRILVTHNHYSLLDEQELPVSVALFGADGRFLFRAPLRDFEVALVGLETRTLTLKYDRMWRQLAAAGIESAEFAGGSALDLRSGQRVAQVDWDGQKTRVDWTVINEVIQIEDTPRVMLEDGVLAGGSGGGIFLDGRHIANNWQAVEHMDALGQVVRVTSVGALNSW